MARIATTIETILAAARDRIVSAGAVVSSAAYITDDPSLPPEEFGITKESAAAVWWTDIAQNPGDYASGAGAGEISIATSRLLVTCWSRQNLDQPGRADAATESQATGAMVFVRRVIAALNDYELTDSEGNELLLESLTFRRVLNRGRLKPGKSRRYDLEFDLKFRWDLEHEESEVLQDTAGLTLRDTEGFELLEP